jgi:hypothetical protein
MRAFDHPINGRGAIPGQRIMTSSTLKVVSATAIVRTGVEVDASGIAARAACIAGASKDARMAASEEVMHGGAPIGSSRPVLTTLPLTRTDMAPRGADCGDDARIERRGAILYAKRAGDSSSSPLDRPPSTCSAPAVRCRA